MKAKEQFLYALVRRERMVGFRAKRVRRVHSGYLYLTRDEAEQAQEAGEDLVRVQVHELQEDE